MTDLATLTDAELKRLLKEIQAELEFRAETRHAERQAKADQAIPGKGNSNGKGKGRK